jgi:phage tail protein X
MRLTTIRTEKNLNALADRLYANLTPDTRKIAVDALLKANPQLAQAGALRPGVVVKLPEGTGLNITAAEISKDPAGDLLDDLKAAVRTYGSHLATTLAAAQADVKAQEAILKQREVAAAIKAAPGADDLAKSLASTLQQRRGAYDAEGKALDATLTEIAKDLDSLK